MSFWSSKRVLVTGGAGFLGSFVVEKLHERGAKEIFVPRSKDYDLVEMQAVQRVYKDAQPDIVIHLAACVGGIGANRANPGKFFYDNLMMGVQLMEVGVGERGQAGFSCVVQFLRISSITLPRIPRGQVGGHAYHVLNPREWWGAVIFHKDGDYFAFFELLAAAKKKFPMPGILGVSNCLPCQESKRVFFGSPIKILRTQLA